MTPHHLLLTDERADGYDPVFKVNPPLRTHADVLALREALVDGTIDVVATDHAPHATQDKECEWGYARPGMVGLETALHRRFADRRVNFVNAHREFFFVTPHDVKEALLELQHNLLTFVDAPEALEWHQSQTALRTRGLDFTTASSPERSAG